MSISTNKLRSAFDMNRMTLKQVEKFMIDLGENYKTESFYNVLEQHREKLTNYIKEIDAATFAARVGE
jgi:hypothetical protein